MTSRTGSTRGSARVTLSRACAHALSIVRTCCCHPLRSTCVLIRRVCAPQTGDVRTYVDPVTGTAAYHTPMGRFVHVLPNTPLADQVTTVETPWWMDGQYQIGSLSQVRARAAQLPQAGVRRAVTWARAPGSALLLAGGYG